MASDNASNFRSFHFGNDRYEQVNRRQDLYDYGQVTWNGRWYEPRYEQKTFCDLLHLTPYHESAIDAKVNILLTTIKLPDKVSERKISYQTLEKLIKDYLVLGHAFPHFRRTNGSQLLQVDHLPGLVMRRGKTDSDFYYLNHAQQVYMEGEDHNWTYLRKNVFMMKRYDMKQGVYGVPGYLGALDAAWLNREATLLRRRFYNNGAHMGFVFLLTAADIPDEDIDALEDQMLQSKGVGNFKNLFLHLPGEQQESVKIIPVGDIATKDDYWNIKISSRNDILAQHRVPLVLLSIMPETNGGLGKPQDAAIVFAKNEAEPLHYVLDQINQFAGETVLEFEDYALPLLPDPLEKAKP